VFGESRQTHDCFPMSQERRAMGVAPRETLNRIIGSDR
jgi:hypothetical protein